MVTTGGFVDLTNWAKIVETGDDDYENALVGKSILPEFLPKQVRQ